MARASSGRPARIPTATLGRRTGSSERGATATAAGACQGRALPPRTTAPRVRSTLCTMPSARRARIRPVRRHTRTSTSSNHHRIEIATQTTTPRLLSNTRINNRRSSPRPRPRRSRISRSTLQPRARPQGPTSGRTAQVARPARPERTAARPETSTAARQATRRRGRVARREASPKPRSGTTRSSAQRRHPSSRSIPVRVDRRPAASAASASRSTRVAGASRAARAAARRTYAGTTRLVRAQPRRTSTAETRTTLAGSWRRTGTQMSPRLPSPAQPDSAVR